MKTADGFPQKATKATKRMSLVGQPGFETAAKELKEPKDLLSPLRSFVGAQIPMPSPDREKRELRESGKDQVLLAAKVRKEQRDPLCPLFSFVAAEIPLPTRDREKRELREHAKGRILPAAKELKQRRDPWCPLRPFVAVENLVDAAPRSGERVRARAGSRARFLSLGALCAILCVKTH
jgi:hypothetical protein